MFYYDLVRFLHERLRSRSTASTYVYYYTYPPIFDLESSLRKISNMVGHFAELDLIWGIPFFNRSNMAYQMNLTYTSQEIEFSLQMIRYWTNFAKTGTKIFFLINKNKLFILKGNPNDPKNTSIYWPIYEITTKSYINLHANKIHIENYFLEQNFQFWDMILRRHKCIPFRWYHTCLLISILILTILLITIYIFYNTKRSRRNIKPTELTTRNILTTYHFVPTVVS